MIAFICLNTESQQKMKECENEKSSKNVENILRQEKKELHGLWSELPQDLLDLISAHLFVADFSTFRAICKSWRSKTPIYRPPPTLLKFPHSDSPCLMSLGGNKCKIYHPIYNSTYHMDIPVLLGARIRFSKYGWLLLSRDKFDETSFFFFHPFNMIKIELPSCPIVCETMSFSSPPTSADCFVIGIPFGSFEFGIIRRGEKSWNIFRFTGHLPRGTRISNCNPILYKRRCYCLSEAGEVLVFDLNEYFRDPNQYSCCWTTFSSGFPKELLQSLVQNYLLESKGKLFAVFEVQDSEPCFHVLSSNINTIVSRMKLKWQVKKDLGNRMLYVSVGGSLSELAAVRGMNNKIYLPNIKDNNCVFYSLKTEMCHSFFNNYSSSISTHGNELNNCTWIKPTLATMDEDLIW